MQQRITNKTQLTEMEMQIDDFVFALSILPACYFGRPSFEKGAET